MTGCFICRPDDPDAPDEGCGGCEDNHIAAVTSSVLAAIYADMGRTGDVLDVLRVLGIDPYMPIEELAGLLRSPDPVRPPAEQRIIDAALDMPPDTATHESIMAWQRRLIHAVRSAHRRQFVPTDEETSDMLDWLDRGGVPQ